MWFNGKAFRDHKGGACSVKPVMGVNSGLIRKGFTLVELLVALTIMVIVAGAAMIMFKTTAENETRQQENLEHIQNLRVAFDTVVRDARMAGNGLGILGTPLIQVYVHADVFSADTSGTQQAAGWFKYTGESAYGARAIFGTDSGSVMNQADTLTIFRADGEAVNILGRLQSPYTPGTDTTLTLNSTLTEGTDLSDGDIIALSTGDVAVILQAKLSGTGNVLTIGPRFKPEEALKEPASFKFPNGTAVFNLKNVSFVTYFLDTANRRLMANYHDRIQDKVTPTLFTPALATVAENIEDFQVNYYLAPSPTATPVPVPSINGSNLAPLATTWVNAVRIGMVSRSLNRGNRGAGSPIDLMGHKASNVSGYARQLMVENIQLRNF